MMGWWKRLLEPEKFSFGAFFNPSRPTLPRKAVVREEGSVRYFNSTDFPQQCATPSSCQWPDCKCGTAPWDSEIMIAEMLEVATGENSLDMHERGLLSRAAGVIRELVKALEERQS